MAAISGRCRAIADKPATGVDLAARNLHQLGLKLKGLAAQFKL